MLTESEGVNEIGYQERVKQNFIKNLISSQGVYNYQSFKQEQTIKSMNLKS